MRKLKVLLITLFAACLSFTLFACGGGGDEKKTLTRVSGTDIEITDSVQRTDFDKLMETYKLTGQNEDGRVEVLGKDCEIIGIDSIRFGTPDRCTVTFKPKENNENGETAEVTVVIDHTWGSADANGVQTCSKDHATRTPQDEDVAIHYGGFHYGTGIGPKGAESNAATAIPQTILSAEDAQTIGLHAETSTTQVFNDDAGINDGKSSSGLIKPFGTDESAAGRPGLSTNVVPTITAGDLTPGMSITIEGYAKTDVAGVDDTTPGGPWNTTNGNWNAPSYGIADPYGVNTHGYMGGNAVIVRSEGWVLYNGIGEANSNNLLGGLPAEITGGKATSNGSSDASNCASRKGDTADLLEGQDVNNRPAYTSSDWKDWWVYSEGRDRHSRDSYQSFTHVRVTWTYRTYGENDEVGIIEITSEYLDEKTTLRSFIKVPTAQRNAYRTIIHGDYSTLLITSSVVVETETVTAMQIDKVNENAKTEYLAGETIKAGDVFHMQVQTAQNSAWHDTGIAIENDMLYYYNATGANNTYANAQTDLETAAKWTQVGNDPLTADMKYFKIVLVRGKSTFHGLVPQTEAEKIHITDNNIAAAYGGDYGDIKGFDPMATYTRALGIDGQNRYADLTITRAVFRALTSAVETELGISTGSADYRYAVIRLVGIKQDGNGFAAGLANTLKGSGPATGDKTYFWAAKTEGNDALLLIAIKQSLLGQAITIEGVQDTPIRLTFGTTSLGFETSSEISYETNPPTLNAGGTVKVEYTGAGFEEMDQFALRVGSSNLGAVSVGDITGTSNANLETDGTLKTAKALGTTGVQVTKYKVEEVGAKKKTTVTFTVPAFNFNNWAEMPRITAQSLMGAVYAEDYVVYDFDFTATTGTGATAAYQCEAITGDSTVHFYMENGTLYVVTASTSAITENTKGGVTVNINDGHTDTAKAFDLTYAYNEFTTAIEFNRGLGDAAAIKTVELKKAYGAYGYFVIASIDIDKATAFADTANFGMQIAEATAQGHYWKYNATDKKLEYVEISQFENIDPTLIKAGDCYTAGIVAKEVKTGSTVDFYAEYKQIGGMHVDKDGTGNNGNGKCDLCGATVDTTKKSPTGWWAGNSTFHLSDGGVLDIVGSYTEKDGNNYKGFAVVVESTDIGHYIFNADGYFEHCTGWDWGSTRVGPYFDVNTIDEEAKKLLNDAALSAFTNGDHNMYNSLITPTHPYNTVNGYKNADGVELNDASVGKVKTEGGQYRYTITYVNKVLTVNIRLYQQGADIGTATPFVDVTMSVSNLTLGNADVVFNGGDGLETQASPITVYQASLNKSVIKSITNQAEATAEYTTAGFENGNAVVKATGMASNMTDGHAVKFQVEFNTALDSSTSVKFFAADGTTEIAQDPDDEGKAHYVLSSDYKKLDVYVPVTLDTGAFYIRFYNHVASSLQSDIKVDLSSLGISNVTVGEAGIDQLNLGDGTFTLTYGQVSATDQLVVNDGTAHALSTIGSTDITLGDGLKVRSQAGFSSDNGGSIILTFTKAAADLDKVIPGYVIDLKNADGKLLANTTIAAPVAIGNLGTQINTDSGWYARAVGNTLYLLANKNTATGTLPVNVNAGYKTLGADNAGLALIGASDLAYTINGTALKFKFIKEWSPLVQYATGVYTADGTHYLAAIKIDLTALSIDKDTAYGFAIETAGAKYYDVAAGEKQRDITEGGSAPSNDITLQAAATCGEIEITAKGNNAQKAQCTYFGLVARGPKEHNYSEAVTGADKLHGYTSAKKCANCGAVEYTEENVTEKWGNKTAWPGGDNAWYKLGTVYKGGYYEVTGLNQSNEANVWDLTTPGLAAPDDQYVQDGNASAVGLRIDHWVMKFGSKLPYVANSQPEANPGMMYWVFEGDDEISFNADVVKTHLDNATITYIFDYTQVDYLGVITNIEDGEYHITVMYVLMGTAEHPLLDSYNLMFHPDGNIYTASRVVTQVPEGKEVPEILDNHVHAFDPATHKCSCGLINPDADAHKDSYVNGVCSVCQFVCWHIGQTGTCAHCGATYGTEAKAHTRTDATFAKWGNADTPINYSVLAAGATMTVEATYKDAGVSTWNGFIVHILKSDDNALKYFFRPAGDYAGYNGVDMVWNLPGSNNAGESVDTSKAGWIGAEGSNEFNSFVALKKTAKTKLTVSRSSDGGTVTIKMEIYGEGGTTVEKTLEWSITGISTTLGLKIGFALDGASADGNISTTGMTDWEWAAD